MWFSAIEMQLAGDAQRNNNLARLNGRTHQRVQNSDTMRRVASPTLQHTLHRKHPQVRRRLGN